MCLLGGDIGLMLVCMTVYAVWFNARNKRELAREAEQTRIVRERFGISPDEKGGGVQT